MIIIHYLLICDYYIISRCTVQLYWNTTTKLPCGCHITAILIRIML